ncbi:Hormone-sensitive Lipase [Phytophthora palmivora]|uniref:Hormone-sensitive Lipase n=1 Tax=Phytophthora palmivora TaxID=4796 RepID=A0A2P4YQW7_9STRA|nr:Hormone-sensitive Lipase [Phytophthora palmivora]
MALIHLFQFQIVKTSMDYSSIPAAGFPRSLEPFQLTTLSIQRQLSFNRCFTLTMEAVEFEKSTPQGCILKKLVLSLSSRNHTDSRFNHPTIFQCVLPVVSVFTITTILSGNG